MKAATVKSLKDNLVNRSHQELVDLCLHLAKFKKENKELLTYLLFEAADQTAYIEGVKTEIRQQFAEINARTFYLIKKSVRKILRMTKKYIRYAKNKEIEAELLICFCQELKQLRPSITRNRVLQNMYDQQVRMIQKAVASLHEDLQYDYEMELNAL